MALPAPWLNVVDTRRCFHLAPAAVFSCPTDNHATLDPAIDGPDLVLHPVKPTNDPVEHIYQLMLTDMPLILLLVFLIMFGFAPMFVAFMVKLTVSLLLLSLASRRRTTLIFLVIAQLLATLVVFLIAIYLILRA